MDNFIIFPNQLFKDIKYLKKFKKILLIEEPLFFSDSKRIKKFNAIKLVYHIATFRYYEDYLKKNNIKVKYYTYENNYKNILNKIKKNKGDFHMYYPFDNLLLKRYKSIIKNNIHNNPHFIDTHDELIDYYNEKKGKLYQTTFYKQQRIKHDILMNDKNKPKGGKLTYDTENRKSLPDNINIPEQNKIKENDFLDYAKKYIKKNIPYFGDINNKILFPLNFKETKKRFEFFLNNKLKNFGKYQDAITSEDKPFLFHSAMSPAFNIGFITQKELIDIAIKFYKKNNIPLNSIEGYIRQIIGWNSFSRLYYVNENINWNNNFLNAKKKLNNKWYTGNTGIPCVDNTIKSAFKYGYLHHIERLMIMLNIMILCEIDYKDIYKWHMEYSLDSYDYLMAYNIYSMGYADGGKTITKPYISSQNYIKKMSDYENGPWIDIWEALYYNFLDRNKKLLKDSPRMGFMYRHYFNKDKKDIEKYRKIAKKFIKSVTK